MSSAKPRSDSPFARALEPLVSALWIFFVVWTVLVVAVWGSGFGKADALMRIQTAGLRDAIVWSLGALDAVWIALAAVNVYLSLAASEGLATARRWGAFVLVVATAIGWASSRTGLPLGAMQFSARLGMQFGPVPLGWALLWFTIIVGAREAVLLVWPRASHGRVAAATALLALATDANIEPLVRQTRLWWRWHPADEDAMPLAPWTNYATWFFAALALAWLMRERSVVPRVARRPWKPAAVLLVLNNVFLLAHLAHLLRR